MVGRLLIFCFDLSQFKLITDTRRLLLTKSTDKVNIICFTKLKYIKKITDINVYMIYKAFIRKRHTRVSYCLIIYLNSLLAQTVAINYKINMIFH